jgi:DsbC/DsbD-like thiol-disulfide interchange protein
MVRCMSNYIPFALAALVTFCATPALANPEEVVLDARLLPGWSTDRGTHMAALSLTLAPGWKTYWRSPGEAGIPPEFDWSASQNLRSVALHWPTPKVFHSQGMQSIGYHDGMLLPIEVTATDPGQPIVLNARVDIGVCEDICVPASLELSVTLTQPGLGDPAIKAALRDQPISAQAGGVDAVSCTTEAISDGLRLTATVVMPPAGHTETVVIEPGLPGVWTSDSAVMRSGNTLTAAADLVGPSGAPFALDRSAIVLTVLGGAQAVEIRGCAAE